MGCDNISLTEELEIWLRMHGINTEGMSNKEIRRLYSEITGEEIDW